MADYKKILESHGVEVVVSHKNDESEMYVSKDGIVWEFEVRSPDELCSGSHCALDHEATGVMYVCTTGDTPEDLVDSLVWSVGVYRRDFNRSV